MADNSKLLSSSTPARVTGGAANSDGNSGPTGSARRYPNAGPTNSPKLPNASKFNPMNSAACTYGLKGC